MEGVSRVAEQTIGDKSDVTIGLTYQVSSQWLSGGFGAEDAPEARPSELDTHQLFTLRGRGANMHNSTVRFKVGFGAPRSVVQKGDANFKVGADGDIKSRDEGSTAAAKIFARRIFFEGDPAIVAVAQFERKVDSDSSFRTLPRY